MVGTKAKKRKATGSDAPSAGKTKSKGKSVDKRKVIYHEITAKVCEGKDALTVSQAKELLGWQEETDEVKFGGEYLISDLRGIKIRCTNNVINRPIYRTQLDTLKQEILRRRWRMNCESMIIGCTGQILNGQHTLIALVLASQEVKLHSDRWSDYWTSEPTIDKCIMFGAQEQDDVVNTMDTCKPRSLGDVIYRSPYFAHLSDKARAMAANIAAFAIRMMWDRTGAGLDAYCPKRTHSEFIDLIERHKRLVKCVEHIYEEAKECKRFTDYIPLGSATGLLYLMGSSATNPKLYSEATAPTEKLLDWKLWDKACDFWVVFASGDDRLKALRQALAYLPEDEDEPGLGRDERCALVANAWMYYAKDEPVTAKGIKLTYDVDPDGFKKLVEFPTVGGIDVGKAEEVVDATPEPKPKAKDKKTSAKANGKAKRKPKKASPSEEQIKKRAKKERSKRKSTDIIGKLMWVTGDSELWRGKVVEAEGANAKLKVMQGFQAAGTIRAVRVKDLHLEQPDNGVVPCERCGGSEFFEDGTCASCY